jgi:hypothetical protein
VTDHPRRIGPSDGIFIPGTRRVWGPLRTGPTLVARPLLRIHDRGVWRRGDRVRAGAPSTCWVLACCESNGARFVRLCCSPPLGLSVHGELHPMSTVRDCSLTTTNAQPVPAFLRWVHGGRASQRCRSLSGKRWASPYRSRRSTWLRRCVLRRERCLLCRRQCCSWWRRRCR